MSRVWLLDLSPLSLWGEAHQAKPHKSCWTEPDMIHPEKVSLLIMKAQLLNKLAHIEKENHKEKKEKNSGRSQRMASPWCWRRAGDILEILATLLPASFPHSCPYYWRSQAIKQNRTISEHLETRPTKDSQLTAPIFLLGYWKFGTLSVTSPKLRWKLEDQTIPYYTWAWVPFGVFPTHLGQFGPGARLSRAQLSAIKMCTVGPLKYCTGSVPYHVEKLSPLEQRAA